ncbi:MAG TPA: hypothetical protein VJ576_19325 [Rhodocyclaceae bacterium]|nr:hypothetical protein [Rhodocyclaceae bacterium]
MHLFTDISSHGFGHLAITGPVLNALAEALPGLRLTVRSGLPTAKLRQRIQAPFEHIEGTSDFGYVMVDALTIETGATADAYRCTHARWERLVEDEARFLQDLAPQYVLTNVAYLPLAGAAAAGIPAASLCSLNWADLFTHFFGREPWAPPIHAQMLAAYRSARAFLRTTPAMAMPALGNTVAVGPIAKQGRKHDLGLDEGVRAVLVAMGGIDHRLPLERWPRHPGRRWLVPAAWGVNHPDAIALESLGLSFTDLLCSVDAVITKPGYGTFTEAACNGVPVLYQRRTDWPEQECLIEWLQAEGRCLEVADAALEAGDLAADLAALWRLPARAAVAPAGARQAADFLAAEITGACSRSA